MVIRFAPLVHSLCRRGEGREEYEVDLDVLVAATTN